MKFTATELSRNPNKVFRAAYDAKGEPITIVHGQYSEGFEIRLRKIAEEKVKEPVTMEECAAIARANAAKDKGHE